MYSLEEIQIEIENNRKKVAYDTADYPIEYICEQFKKETFYVPKYQREFVWNNEMKSRFIESILMGLPIQFLFLYRERSTGKLEIVDGAQRIQAINSFFRNELMLVGLKKISKINKYYFKDLPSKFQFVFSSTPLRVIILDDKTSETFRQEIFNRLNTSGMKLEPMEVILGSHKGRFIEFLKECSVAPLFKKLCPIPSSKIKRKENIELVLRFFAYSEKLDEYTGTVAPFLADFTRKMSENFDEIKMSKEFYNMLNFVDKYFPYGFRKGPNQNSTPRTRFEAISIGTNFALRNKENLIPKDMDWIDSEEFKKVTTTDSANNTKKLKERINFVENALLKGVKSE